MTRRILACAVLVLALAAPRLAGDVRAATPGAIAALIQEARTSERSSESTAFQIIELGLTKLGNDLAAVTEALDILDAHSETPAILGGLLRGFSLFSEHATPAIESRIRLAFCSYKIDPDEYLRSEADESIRLRCPKVPGACSCPP